jgi:hypothetical protein
MHGVPHHYADIFPYDLPSLRPAILLLGVQNSLSGRAPRARARVLRRNVVVDLNIS